ncbi:MAG: 3-isopropylmalate dehydratase small subunit, partial [Flavobacteriaceae bacterium]
YDYGFRCVVSSFFADIFKNNCLNIGVLPVQVSESFLETLFETITANPKTSLTVDLPQQTITLDEKGIQETFEINPYKKENLQNGYDDIDYLLNLKGEIEHFAKTRPF